MTFSLSPVHLLFTLYTRLARTGLMLTLLYLAMPPPPGENRYAAKTALCCCHQQQGAR